MLHELSLVLLLPAELLTLASRLIQVCKGALMATPFIQKLLALCEQDRDEMEKVLARVRNSGYTQQLFARDEARDGAFVALRDLVKASVSRALPEVRQAGELISERIKKYGFSLHRLGYTQESTQLQLLIHDLDQSPATEALKTLGAESWYADLKTAQVSFEETYQHKVAVEAQEDFPLLREAKAKLGRHLQLLLDCVGLLEEINESPEIPLIVEKLNMVITDVMTPARARKKRNEKEVEPTV